MRTLVFFLLCCLSTLAIHAQKPVSIALRPGASEPETRAANVLRSYLQQITGQPVPLQSAEKVPDGYAPVLLGKHPALQQFGFQQPPALPDDAFFLEGKNGAFLIAGGGDMGAEYGVYTLLELLGCRKYSPRDSFIPDIKNLQLPAYPPATEIPAFPYRELHYEPAFDEGWARWHKLKTRRNKDADWGLFVHTFQHLCPAERYFAEHPEYFAWNGAQRSPGQLCLSNDTVRQIVTDALREKIREKPDAKYWSVSQNDNFDYCKCPRCAAADARYGSPAGTLLAFVNKIAASFPDKTLSTLAYQYTRQAPKGIKPAKNVSVCLCSIECNRGQSIEDGCTDFARDVRAWSALTSHLMIWDYVVQFRSYVSPFPNWHTLQPNLQFFRQNGVNMVFEQGSGRDCSEFSDMRAYLLAKLMWNPQANMDSILTDFGDGYYGSARPAIWAYIHRLTEAVLKGDGQLTIYNIPQNEPFLDSAGLDIMNRELGQLLRTHRDDSVFINRMMGAYTPVLFARMERSKTDSTQLATMLKWPTAQLDRNLRAFTDGCARAGIRNLHEGGYTPDQYRLDYLAFVDNMRRAAASRTTSVSLTTPASATYAKGDPNELINRRIGETDYRYNWLGFQGVDLQATATVGGTEPVSTIQVSFLQDQQSWVFFPEKVVFEISPDGQHFQQVLEENIVIRAEGGKRVRLVEARFDPQPVRAVRVTAVNIKTCPAWHTCNGNPCWIFADEVGVW